MNDSTMIELSEEQTQQLSAEIERLEFIGYQCNLVQPISKFPAWHQFTIRKNEHKFLLLGKEGTLEESFADCIKRLKELA